MRHFPLLAQVAIGAVSKVATSDLQHKLLDHSSTVVEAAVHLVTIAREVRGTPHNYEGHKKVDQGAKLLQEAVGELTEVAEDICNKNRLVGGQCMHGYKSICTYVQNLHATLIDTCGGI